MLESSAKFKFLIYGIFICMNLSPVSAFGKRLIRLGADRRGDYDWDTSASNEQPLFRKRVGQSWSPDNTQADKGWQPSVGSGGAQWPSQSKDYDDSSSWKEWDQPQATPQGNNKGSNYPGDQQGPGRLEDLLRGVPGEDYPNFYTIPETSFNCNDQQSRGYYSDVEAGCQVFHICQPEGRKDSFLCPVGTIFNQKYFVCDWWFNVNCSDTPNYYNLNAEVYKEVAVATEAPPQVTTEKPKVRTPQTPAVVKPQTGTWGGSPAAGPGKTSRTQPSWGGGSQGQTRPPSRPATWDTSKGSSASTAWSQGSSSVQSSSWGHANTWKRSEVRGDNAWNDAVGSGSQNYVNNHVRNSLNFNGEVSKQPQQWSTTAGTQGTTALTQVKHQRSYNLPFGARMKPLASTVAPGNWQPTVASGIEPTTHRRGLSHRGPSNTQAWFSDQRNPIQVSTLATSINPSGVRGVWEQESIRNYHNTWSDNDYEEHSPNTLPSDQSFTSATELFHDYDTTGSENPWRLELPFQRDIKPDSTQYVARLNDQITEVNEAEPTTWRSLNKNPRTETLFKTNGQVPIYESTRSSSAERPGKVLTFSSTYSPTSSPQPSTTGSYPVFGQRKTRISIKPGSVTEKIL